MVGSRVTDFYPVGCRFESRWDRHSCFHPFCFQCLTGLFGKLDFRFANSCLDTSALAAAALRRVRLLHPAPLLSDGAKEMIWDDIRTAPRQHMQVSFQHRRQGIVGDCRQMKVDVDSYNDAHKDAQPIQIVFDFTMDLPELEAADEAA